MLGLWKFSNKYNDKHGMFYSYAVYLTVIIDDTSID